MEPVIRFENVSKRYYLGSQRAYANYLLPGFAQRWLRRDGGGGSPAKEIWALRDVSFEVRPGETLGIIGPNGAGKTTILSLVAGITTPTSGHIGVRGRVGALIQLGAGFHPELTGRENVYLNASILGLKEAEVDRIYDGIVAFAELEKFIDTPVKRYSSGMYARLGFAVAVHIDPDILLVDEVLSVGDLSFRCKCQKKMRALRERGTTIVFVSHNMYAVQGICEEAIFLLDGTVKYKGPATSVVQSYENWIHEAEFSKAGHLAAVEESTSAADRVVELCSVRLVAQDGRPTSRFSFGEDLTVEIELRANERVERPLFSIIVVRSDGLRCCVVRSSSLNVAYLVDVCLLRVTIRDMQLNAGTYFLEFAIADETAAPFLYERVSSFLILDPPKENVDPTWGGIFIPAAEWCYEPVAVTRKSVTEEYTRCVNLD